jgi:hypothetical protein
MPLYIPPLPLAGGTVTGAVTVDGTVTPSGGIAPITSGFTSFGTGGLNQALNSTSGFSLTPVAGTFYYASLWIPFDVTLTGVVASTGVTGGTDDWIAALWGIGGGAALANSSLSGVAAPSGGTKQKFPFTGTLPVTGPAAYIIGMQSNGTHAQFLAFPNAAEGFITGSVAGVFGTVPSLSPASTYTANTGPFAGTY